MMLTETSRIFGGNDDADARRVWFWRAISERRSGGRVGAWTLGDLSAILEIAMGNSGAGKTIGCSRLNFGKGFASINGAGVEMMG